MDELAEWQRMFHTFLPVLVRLATFWVAVPILGQGVPPIAKVGFASLLALIVLPYVSAPPLPAEPAVLGIRIAGEALVGLTLGYMVTLVFSAVYLAGQFVDVPMGFGMSHVIDPHSGMQVPLFAQFQHILAILIFFTINGHHALIQALVVSFDTVPIYGTAVGVGVVQFVLTAFSQLFVLALRIGIPIMGAIFLTDVTLGILARAVPQLNVFVVGFPIKIAVGLLIYLAVLPVYVGVIADVVGSSGELMGYLRTLLARLGGA